MVGDQILTAAGRLFTIGKIVFGVAAAGVTAWGVSFWVADYVTTKSVNGLTVAVQNLQSTVNQLADTVRTVDQDLKAEGRVFREARASLASEIAKELANLQGQQIGQRGELVEIRNGIARLEKTIDGMRGTAVRFEVGGSNADSAAVQKALGSTGWDIRTPVLVVPAPK